jgi:hypothetical protein
LELQNLGIRLTQTLKENFQQCERHFGVCLKAVEKLVPPDLTHHSLGNGCHGCTAWLLVNHAHFAKGFPNAEVSQVDFLPVELLAYFNLSFPDDVSRFANVVFSNNNFSSLILAQRNHNASSISSI